MDALIPYKIRRLYTLKYMECLHKTTLVKTKNEHYYGWTDYSYIKYVSEKSIKWYTYLYLTIFFCDMYNGFFKVSSHSSTPAPIHRKVWCSCKIQSPSHLLLFQFFTSVNEKDTLFLGAAPRPSPSAQMPLSCRAVGLERTQKSASHPFTLQR